MVPRLCVVFFLLQLNMQFMHGMLKSKSKRPQQQLLNTTFTQEEFLRLLFYSSLKNNKDLRKTLTVNWHLALLPAASDAV